MSYIPHKRDTLLIPSASYTDYDRKHLFIILTNKSYDNTHLVVSISSIKTGMYYDETTILEAGSHPFIKKRSFVLYQKADVLKSDKIIKFVKTGYYLRREPINEGLIERICDGILLSEHTPPWIIKYFQRNRPSPVK